MLQLHRLAHQGATALSRALSSWDRQLVTSSAEAWAKSTAQHSRDDSVVVDDDDDEAEAPTDVSIDESTRISHDRLRSNPIVAGSPAARFQALAAVRLLSPVLADDAAPRCQAAWLQLVSQLGPIEAARLVGMTVRSPASAGWLFSPATRQLARDSDADGAAIVASLTQTWPVADVATALLEAAPAFVDGWQSDVRRLGAFVGACARARDKRDGDEIVFRFLARWSDAKQPLQLEAAAQLAGAAIGVHAQGWEDEDVGWAVRYFMVDFDIWWATLPAGLLFPRSADSLVRFTSHLIFEVVLAVGRARSPSLVEHLLNVTTDAWDVRHQQAAVVLVHTLLRPHESFLSRLLG